MLMPISYMLITTPPLPPRLIQMPRLPFFDAMLFVDLPVFFTSRYAAPCYYADYADYAAYTLPCRCRY